MASQRFGAFLVEMLAAIPSVVYGFWGMYVLAPALQTLVAQLGGPDQAGIGILPAGLVLGIMIVPYVAAVSFDVIRAVPSSQRQAALAAGATKWQTLRTVVLPYAQPGIIGGSFLALGRALGETMAVTMLIGNRPDIVFSIFAKGNSIPSVIANEFTEATYDLYLSSLVELGLVLLLVSVAFSAAGRLLTWSVTKQARPRKSLLGGIVAFWRPTVRNAPEGPKDETSLPPQAIASGSPSAHALGLAGSQTPRLLDQQPDDGRRRAVRPDRLSDFAFVGGGSGWPSLSRCRNRFYARNCWPPSPPPRCWCPSALSASSALCLAVTTVPLFLILGYLLYRGGTSLNWDFFTKLPQPVGQTGGGMANAFYGSFAHGRPGDGVLRSGWSAGRHLIYPNIAAAGSGQVDPLRRRNAWQRSLHRHRHLRLLRNRAADYRQLLRAGRRLRAWA